MFGIMRIETVAVAIGVLSLTAAGVIWHETHRPIATRKPPTGTPHPQEVQPIEEIDTVRPRTQEDVVRDLLDAVANEDNVAIRKLVRGEGALITRPPLKQAALIARDVIRRDGFEAAADVNGDEVEIETYGAPRVSYLILAVDLAAEKVYFVGGCRVALCGRGR